MPIALRAWSRFRFRSKHLKASTRIWVGAKEPKSTSVPAQSKIRASRRGAWERGVSSGVFAQGGDGIAVLSGWGKGRGGAPGLAATQGRAAEHMNQQADKTGAEHDDRTHGGSRANKAGIIHIHDRYRGQHSLRAVQKDHGRHG